MGSEEDPPTQEDESSEPTAEQSQNAVEPDGEAQEPVAGEESVAQQEEQAEDGGEGTAPAPAESNGEPNGDPDAEAPQDSQGEAQADEQTDGEQGGEEGETDAEHEEDEGDEEQQEAEAGAVDAEEAAEGAPEPEPAPLILESDLKEIPLPYALNEEGKPIPLPGVESIFCTGTTLELLGLAGLGKEPEGGGPPVKQMTVSKETLLHDIQFRGAISDLQIVKQKVIDADYDPLWIRFNEDDIYGDGNNIELACLQSAVEVWESIEVEKAKHAAYEAQSGGREAEEKAAARLARKERLQNPQPWESLGSELEIEEASVKPRRELIKIEAQRRRREFCQVFKLSDKDAHELWNSSQMECRPFKDPNFELRRMEVDQAIQAVAPLADACLQATSLPPRPNSTQYEPRDIAPELKAQLLQDKAMLAFLDRAKPLCEEALVQNEITNIFEDDFSALSEEDGVSGNRKENAVSEFQSFTHLTYSKNKVVSAIQWLPHRKGVIAVACTENLSHAERVARAGRPSNAYILIWNFKDPIHPEYVLEAPFEVFAFQYNPLNPDVLAGGSFNGQIVVWDTSHDYERIMRAKSHTRGEEAGDEAAIPVVKYRFLSAVDFSHHSMVTDLQWLPGLEFKSGGRVTRLAEGSQECNFFASSAADGRINFWDIRVERLMKKGRKEEDPLQLVWKPTHSVQLLSLAGMDLGCAKICFNFTHLEAGQFYVGSIDGEIVYADFVKPEGQENPDYCRFCLPAHAGSVVSIERSPFFDDIILSVGDWSFQIWKEGSTTPLFQSGCGLDYYTAGCWSPTRPAVLYLVGEAGHLEIWDMLDRSHEPSIKVTPASSPLMSISFISGASAAPLPGQQAASQPQFLALGDSSGVLHIMEMPRNLRRPVPNEKRLMQQFLQREVDRVTDVAARAPIRSEVLKEAQEAAKERDLLGGEDGARDTGSRDQGGRFGNGPLHGGVDEKAEMEYYKLEHEFKVQLGLIEDDDSLHSSGRRGALD